MNNECEEGERLKVCLVMKIIDDLSMIKNEYHQAIIDWLDDIKIRENSEKPHFIILPMGDDINVLCNKHIMESSSYGYNNMVVGSCGPYEAFRTDYKFAFTPYLFFLLMN